MYSSSPPFNVFFNGGNDGPNTDGAFQLGVRNDGFLNFIQNGIRRMSIQPTGSIMFQTAGPNQGETKLTCGGAITAGAVSAFMNFNMATSQAPESVDMAGMVFTLASCSDIPATGNEANFIMTTRWRRINDVLTVDPASFIYQNTTDAGILIDYVEDANQLRLEVTGIAGVNLNWSGYSLTTYERIFV